MGDARDVMPVLVCCGLPVLLSVALILASWLKAKGTPLDRWAKRTAQVRRGATGRSSVVYHFSHRRADAQINMATMHGRPWTQLHLPFPDRRFQLEVAPTDSRFDLAFQVPTWKPTFGRISEWFKIRANDPALANQIFDAPGQAAVIGLATWHPAPMYLAINQGHMMIAVAAKLKTDDEINGFLRLGLSIYDHAVAALEKGISFDTEAPAVAFDRPGVTEASPFRQPSQDTEKGTPPSGSTGPRTMPTRTRPSPEPIVATCGYCSGELDSDLVYCQKCQTPMHRACWVESGRCVTYGCGSTMYSNRPPATR